jgi:hypothetical protein
VASLTRIHAGTRVRKSMKLERAFKKIESTLGIYE